MIMGMVESYTPTERTQLKRRPERAVYDKAKVYSILDEGYYCHLGFVVKRQPYVIPTLYVRDGDRLYLHGSAAGRMLQTLASGIPVCVTVTLVDGFVLARSAFHHSMNYRSVVVLGKATPVTDPAEKLAALRRFTNSIVPGRWEEVRNPSDGELKATQVLSVALAEVSAKVRSGPPLDDESDYALQVWAGVVPIHTLLGLPQPDERVLPGVATIDVQRLARGRDGRGPETGSVTGSREAAE